MPPTDPRILAQLSAWRLDRAVRDHVRVVLSAVPSSVRDDLLGDPRFRVSDYEPISGRMAVVAVSPPDRAGGGRSVVLKRTLRDRPASFARWVVAHELAHAHLRNRGRDPGEDPESAADALAAEWGFPRP